MTNNIDPTAFIDPRVKLGEHNRIGKNVQIRLTDPKCNATAILGDSNIINDNTRILVGKSDVVIGDWNVFHNDMLVMGNEGLSIGHNCWFGQNTILDGSGVLSIGNGVRVGMYSQIWTHVASGELIEGCTLYGFRETVIEDDVWLVGSCLVGSGITIGKRTVVLSQSNITKDLKPNSVYAGSPAIEKPNLKFYKEISIEEKMHLMESWVNEFISINPQYLSTLVSGSIEIRERDGAKNYVQIGIKSDSIGEDVSYFNVKTKIYTKRNTQIERDFYRFIYGNRARFLPQ